MGKHYQPAADNASAIACTLDLCQINFTACCVFEVSRVRASQTNLHERVHGFVIERTERLCAEPQCRWRDKGVCTGAGWSGERQAHMPNELQFQIKANSIQQK